MKTIWDVIIVGAGIAGVTAARTLVASANGGEVLLVNGEDRIPYKRTKVSKNIAAGFVRDAFALESEGWYADNRITLKNSTNVTRIDPAAHELSLSDGTTAGYRKLILATGSRPIAPDLEAPGSLAPYLVRSAGDVDRLIPVMRRGERAVIIGGGVLGVEVADQLRLAGKKVTMVAKSARIMTARLDEYASQHMLEVLRENGVEVFPGAEVRSVRPAATIGVAHRSDSPRRANVAVDTKHGTVEREADFVVAAIGVVPNVDLAVAAGLEVNQGIIVDPMLRTNAPDIYAAGDAAEHAGGRLSYLWHAAERQGQVVAANVAGGNEAYGFPPFRLKCEVFGRYFFSAGDIVDLAGSAVASTISQEGGRYRRMYFRDRQLVGAIMIDDGERAKLYQRAVFEGWDEKQIEQDLPWRS